MAGGPRGVGGVLVVAGGVLVVPMVSSLVSVVLVVAGGVLVVSMVSSLVSVVSSWWLVVSSLVAGGVLVVPMVSSLVAGGPRGVDGVLPGVGDVLPGILDRIFTAGHPRRVRTSLLSAAGSLASESKLRGEIDRCDYSYYQLFKCSFRVCFYIAVCQLKY